MPNISLGFGIIEAIRRSTRLPIDLHLMIDQPERYLERFVATGANLVTVHCEAARHLHRALTELRTLGAQAGLALAPATPLTMVEEVLVNLDLLLVMTINPGFGGQALIPATIGKVRRARALLDAQQSVATLQVDGGVKSHNAAALTQAGATCLVVGTGIFEAPGGHPDWGNGSYAGRSREPDRSQLRGGQLSRCANAAGTGEDAGGVSRDIDRGLLDVRNPASIGLTIGVAHVVAKDHTFAANGAAILQATGLIET